MGPRLRPLQVLPPNNYASFPMPRPTGEALAAFLGVPTGTPLSRIDVTRQIGEYIKKHSLQKEGDGRFIYADDKLAALLNVPLNADGKYEFHYFKLQQHLQPHFPNIVMIATAMSDVLADFLGKSRGTIVKYDYVISRIWDYIGKHVFRRKCDTIYVDASLAKLFDLPLSKKGRYYLDATSINRRIHALYTWA